MVAMEFVPRQYGMAGGSLECVPAFPGESFSVGMPESIGDAAHTTPIYDADALWTDTGGGVWTCAGGSPGELDYALTVTPAEDWVDFDFVLTNRSTRHWDQSMAFNCFMPLDAPSVKDHECVRHWCRQGRRFRTLTEVPRRFSARPTVQAYSIAGAPRADTLPCTAHFHATPDVLLDDWLAIVARDGARLMAAVSRPALFLFQNMEYSCIHSAAGFGALGPGETGCAKTRLYLVQSSLPTWYARMKAELGE